MFPFQFFSKTPNLLVTLPYFLLKPVSPPSLSDPEMARLLIVIILYALPSPVVPIHNSSTGGNLCVIVSGICVCVCVLQHATGMAK